MKNLLPAEVSELAVKVSEKKQQEVNTVLNQIFTGTAQWESQVESIQVKDINDVMGIQLADTARLNVKKARLSAEKIFDAKRDEVQQIKAEYDLEDKLWLKAKQVMQIKFKAIEEKAEWKANTIKRHQSEQREMQIQLRLEKAQKFNPEISRYEIEHMVDDTFNVFLSGLEKAHNDRIKAERKAEEERIAREKAIAEEQERIRKENAKLKAEAEAREAAMKAEREKAEAERKAAEEKARKEMEAYELRLKAEAEAREKIERESKAKAEAEDKARKEKELAEKKAKAAPDKQKLNQLAIDLKTFALPDVKSDEAKVIIESVKVLITKTADYITSKTREL
jgi:hypothetical protein